MIKSYAQYVSLAAEDRHYFNAWSNALEAAVNLERISKTHPEDIEIASLVTELKSIHTRIFAKGRKRDEEIFDMIED